MSEYKWTPGPWTIFRLDGVETIMPAMREGEIATGITNPADATLIQAAPELVAALEAFMAWDDAGMHYIPWSMLLSNARALLARIKGETE